MSKVSHWRASPCKQLTNKTQQIGLTDELVIAHCRKTSCHTIHCNMKAKLSFCFQHHLLHFQIYFLFYNKHTLMAQCSHRTGKQDWGRVHTYTSTSTSVWVPKNMKSSTYLWQAFTQTRVPVRVQVTRKLTDTGRVCTGSVFSQPVLVYLAFNTRCWY